MIGAKRTLRALVGASLAATLMATGLVATPALAEETDGSAAVTQEPLGLAAAAEPQEDPSVVAGAYAQGETDPATGGSAQQESVALAESDEVTEGADPVTAGPQEQLSADAGDPAPTEDATAPAPAEQLPEVGEVAAVDDGVTPTAAVVDGESPEPADASETPAPQATSDAATPPAASDEAVTPGAEAPATVQDTPASDDATVAGEDEASVSIVWEFTDEDAPADTPQDEADPAVNAEDELRLDGLDTQASKGLNGVDVSGWNEHINYSKIGDFIIIKATEYSSSGYTAFTDYVNQADGALAAGKLIGFYHFATSRASSGQSWEQQAKAFVNAISLKDSKGAYKYLGKALLCLDWENTNYSTVEYDVAGAKTWLDTVYKLTGVKPYIYMNKSCSNEFNWSSVANAGYKLWGAQYLYSNMGTNSFKDNPGLTSGWGAWGTPTVYQYATDAVLHSYTYWYGYVYNCPYDLDKFYGTREDWLKDAAGDRPEMEAKEQNTSAADAAKLLTNGAVYQLKPTTDGSALVSTSGSDVKLASTAKTLASCWRVENLGSGLYHLISMVTGKALSYGTSVAKGTNVTQGAANTTWRLVKCTNGALALIPEGHDGYRLSVAGSNLNAAGANMQLATKDGTANQRFFFTKMAGLTEAYKLGKTASEGTYKISYGKDTTKALDIAGGSVDNGGNLQIYKSNDTMAQRYRLNYQGNGLYTISSAKSDKLVEVAGGATANFSNVQQNQASNTLGQLWYFKKSGTNYIICSAASGLALDIYNGQTTNKSNAQVYRQNGTAAQTFRLVTDKVLTAADKTGKLVPEGIYNLVLSTDADRVMDVAGGSVDKGANIQLWRDNGSMAQRFRVSYLGHGLYSVSSDKSGKVLDVAGGSTASGANLQQWNSNGTRAQLWYFVKDGSGYKLCSALSGMAVTVQDGKADKGANLRMEASSKKALQTFVLNMLPSVADGTYAFSSGVTNYGSLVLDVANGATTEGANVQVWQSNGTEAQKWTLVHQGNGIFTIASAKSDLLLGVAGTGNGANVALHKLDAGDETRWLIELTGSGKLLFKNVKSGKYLEVSGGKSASGTNVAQNPASSAKAQQWFVKADHEVPPAGKLGNFVKRMVYYTDIANVGYDQSNRWDIRDGGECDCSSLVIQCLKETGFATGSATYTGNMSSNLTARGWKRIAYATSALRPGDIVLNDNYHVVVVVSGKGANANVAFAYMDENGGASGGKAGDQTGVETRIKSNYAYPYGWDCILRYVG